MKEALEALHIALCYMRDIEATERAGIDTTGYKKGVLKRDIEKIEKAIKKLENENTTKP